MPETWQLLASVVIMVIVIVMAIVVVVMIVVAVFVPMITVIVILMGAACGYAISQLRFPGRMLLWWMILASFMVPIQALIVNHFVIMAGVIGVLAVAMFMPIFKIASL